MKERRGDENIMAFVMAGGAGARLRPLTDMRSKPAVPFGARYRIVDFVLSNLVNSRIYTIYLLVQYKSQSLIEHVRKAWQFGAVLPGHFVTVVPPQMLTDAGWFQGTADAVYQNIALIKRHRPELVAVFGADHIYRMDVRQMVRHHHERRADVTIAARPVPIRLGAEFGTIAADAECRVTGFFEKSAEPPEMGTYPGHALASMGNYLFETDVLIEALEAAHRRGEADFGRDILPRLLQDRVVVAYDFSANEIPGLKHYEHPAYWRDVGTIETYFSAHQDMLGQQPRFDEFNPQWPIYSSNYQGPVARIDSGELENCLLGAASVVNGARLRNCILRREVVVEPDAELHNCILMDYVRIERGARLKNVIVDRHRAIRAGTRIGYDAENDRRSFHVTPTGIVVVPKGEISYYARDTRKSGRSGYEE